MKKNKWKIAFSALIISGVLLSSYWRDVPLTAQAIALDQPVLATIDEKENGYFYFVGLTSEREKNPAEVGKAYITEYETLLQASPPASAKQFQQLNERPSIKFVVSANEHPHSICRVQNEACINKFVLAADKLRKIELDNSALIERYETLLKYPQYAEVSTPSTYLSFTSFSATQGLNQLRCAKAAIRLASGNTDAALDSLETSIQFWHNNLRGSTTLLSRMVATANLKTSYYFLNDFFYYNPTIAQSHYGRIQKILANFNSADTDFTNPIKGEFRFGANFFKRMKVDKDESLARDEIAEEKLSVMEKVGLYLHKTPLFRTNATVNRHAEIFTRYLELAQLPAHELIEKKQKVSEYLQRDFDPANHWLRDSTYNLFGNRLLSAGFPPLFDFQLRTHELNGYVRLLKLKLEIRRRALPLTDVPAYLSSADSTLFNPYTRQPMSWDAKTGKLSFNPATPGDNKAIEVGI